MFLPVAFQHIPSMSYILFVIPENAPLCEPFYLPKWTPGSTGLVEDYSKMGDLHPDNRNSYFTPIPSKLAKNYGCFVCSKAGLLSPFIVRKCRLEDWDDLLPILTNQHVNSPLADVVCVHRLIPSQTYIGGEPLGRGAIFIVRYARSKGQRRNISGS